ncbi:MAG: ATP-dependent DNA ligase, partial [Chloroflexi bacterium]
MEVAGREVKVTNLEKVFFPQHGLTKGDLIQY